MFLGVFKDLFFLFLLNLCGNMILVIEDGVFVKFYFFVEFYLDGNYIELIVFDVFKGLNFF